MEQNILTYTEKLSSKSPVPGGGGVAALCGAMGAALTSMVCNLTIGKPRYMQYEDEVKEILCEAELLRKKLMLLAEEDEVAFEPLSRAYSLPTSTEEEKAFKASFMEKCLSKAADVPFKTAQTAYEGILLCERIVDKGSRLAISDVGVAAAAFKCALQSAVLNVYINTKFMSNKTVANELNGKTEKYLTKGVVIADEVYKAVTDMLKQ